MRLLLLSLREHLGEEFTGTLSEPECWRLGDDKRSRWIDKLHSILHEVCDIMHQAPGWQKSLEQFGISCGVQCACDSKEEVSHSTPLASLHEDVPAGI